MAKGKALKLPDTPTYQEDPVFQQGYKSLMDWGQNLSSGNFGWLTPLLDNSQNALKQAQNTLQPQFRDTLTQIKNEAAAAGQLESSTFTDALARSQSDLDSRYQSAIYGQAIADNNTKLGLFGTGLNTIGQATTFGLQNQNNENQFNLQNYDNLVAQAIQNNKNANRANGWQQALGMLAPVAGGAAGFMLGGPAGAAIGAGLGGGLGKDYLDSQGINNVPGWGSGDVMKLAAPFMGGFGMGGGGGIPSTSPGMSASNNPFGLIGKDYGQLYLRN